MIPQQIKIDKARLQSDLAQAEAELGLWKLHLNAMLERGDEERHFIGLVWQVLNQSIGKMDTVPPRKYLEAHKQDNECKANLVRLTIAKMSAQVEVMKRMLEEADRNVVVPQQF